MVRERLYGALTRLQKWRLPSAFLVLLVKNARRSLAMGHYQDRVEAMARFAKYPLRDLVELFQANNYLHAEELAAACYDAGNEIPITVDRLRELWQKRP